MMNITITQFLNQLHACNAPNLYYLEIENWLWDHFAFEDGRAVFIGTGDAPPEQPGMSEARQ